MYKYLITIGTLLLWTGNLLGQIQNDIHKVLATKDFVTFKKYTDSLSNKNNKIYAYWECLRDLTTDFQEGVFIIEESVPDKSNPRVSTVYTYRVNLIATKTNLIYYELSEWKNRKVGDNWEPYYERISQFRDDVAFNLLKVSFKSIFQSDLNESELFTIGFVYGSYCGYAGIKTNGLYQEINRNLLNG